MNFTEQWLRLVLPCSICVICFHHTTQQKEHTITKCRSNLNSALLKSRHMPFGFCNLHTSTVPQYMALSTDFVARSSLRGNGYPLPPPSDNDPRWVQMDGAAEISNDCAASGMSKHLSMSVEYSRFHSDLIYTCQPRRQEKSAHLEVALIHVVR